MRIKWPKDYIPETIEPSPTQLAFTMIPHMEALFGGAAGGGKSVILLANALQYVDVPNYAGLILRRSLTELKQPGALLDLARQWLSRTPARYLAEEHTYEFPTRWPDGSPGPPSKLQFGYLGDHQAEIRYQGAAYQYIAFDELTHFENDSAYLYLFSRLRKNVCPKHKLAPDADGVMSPNYLDDCEICQLYKNLPLRIRAATNPGGPGHCVPHGEVLTEEGWKDIQDVSLGEKVYSVDPEGRLVLKKVLQTHASRYSGKLIAIEARGFSATFTPNHSLVYVKETGEFELRTFEELPGQARLLRSPLTFYGKLPSPEFRVPQVDVRKEKLDQPDSLSWENYCELLGWFLSEGHTLKRDSEFGISQTKAKNLPVIEDLLRRCGFKYRKHSSGFVVCSKKWCSYLSQFGKCRDKFIPGDILSLPKEYLEILLNALMLGDGSQNIYYTTSKRLADDVSELCLKLGYKVSVYSRERPNRKGRSYSVNMSKSKLPVTEILTGNHLYSVTTETKRKSNITKYEYTGNVYCIGVEDTHNFVFRQNGSVWISGNSWVKNRFQITKKVVPNSETGEARITWVGGDPNRPFIPSKILDNVFLDQQSYIKSLSNLDELRRQQLEEGDWDASPDSRFNTKWAKFYTSRGDYFQVGPYTYHVDDLEEIFITCDPAASTKEGPIDVDVNPRGGPSYTVISVWGITHDFNLLWLHMKRFREEIPFVIDEIIDSYRRFKAKYVYIETNGLGIGPAQIISAKGVNIYENRKTRDKIQNAGNAIYRMKAGKVWFPETAHWLKTCMDEVFTWTGHPGTPDDIVDTLSDACNIVTDKGRNHDPLLAPLPSTSMPKNAPMVITMPPSHINSRRY